MYLRFESYLRDRDYKFRLGIFQAAINLRDNEAVADYARDAIHILMPQSVFRPKVKRPV